MSQETIRNALAAVLADMGAEGAPVQLERPRDPTHGDLASNVAMTLAKRLGRPPRHIAEEIVARLDLGAAGVSAVEVAGPGFLNFRLTSGAVASVLDRVLAEGRAFGRSTTGGGRKVMVEFVSANPTGPLHLGHGRQAALGDAIASLLEWTGWDVHREYYYNDSGNQMDNLARSVWARYQELHGRSAEIPEGGYQGEYVKDIAEAFSREAGDRWVGQDTPEALDAMRHFAVGCCAASRTATSATSACASTSTSWSRPCTPTGRWTGWWRRCAPPGTCSSGRARRGCAPPSSATTRTGS